MSERQDEVLPDGPHIYQQTKTQADGTYGREPSEMIKEEIARGDAAMVRTDTKAGLLLAILSPIMAVGVPLLTAVSLHPAVTVLLVAAAGMLGTAILQLLWTIRPQLAGSGLLTYSTMTHEQLAQHFAQLAVAPERWHCERLIVVSQLGLRKFRLVRLASMLITMTTPLLASAALVTLVHRP
jgi:pycsar effector protein